MSDAFAYYEQASKMASLQIQAAQARRVAAVREKTARDNAIAQLYNQGGQANSLHTLQSRGVGDIDVPNPVMFSVTFTSEPFFTSGAAIVLPMPEGATRTPWAAATVRSWNRDEDGCYSGAFVSLHVAAPELTTDEDGIIDSTRYVMTHYLAFQGLAYKNLGQEALASIQSVIQKNPGFGS
jgi:hypothetical protein